MLRRPLGIWLVAFLLPPALLFSCDGDEEAARRKLEQTPPTANFKLGEVRGVDAQDRPEAAQRASEEAGKIVSMLNAYYDAAFVDPSKWQAGAHPDLASVFAAEIHPQLGPHLGALALADLAPRISKLKPTKQEAPRVTFLMETDLSAPHAIVTSLFEATGTATKKSESPVAIAHTATLWLIREGDVYKIIGFKTHLVADSETKSADLHPLHWEMAG